MDGQKTPYRFQWNSKNIGWVEVATAGVLYFAGYLSGKGYEVGFYLMGVYTVLKNIIERTKPTDPIRDDQTPTQP